MTRLQLLERENKDLKIKNKVLKNEIEILKDLRKEEQRKIDELNKKSRYAICRNCKDEY